MYKDLLKFIQRVKYQKLLEVYRRTDRKTISQQTLDKGDKKNTLELPNLVSLTQNIATKTTFFPKPVAVVK